MFVLRSGSVCGCGAEAGREFVGGIMVVFFDTGGGDIYAGPTKEAVIAAIKADVGEEDFVEADMREVSGKTKMRVSNENDEPTDELITLEDEYGNDTDAYCIASENC